jgi:hypothetical protein
MKTKIVALMCMASLLVVGCYSPDAEARKYKSSYKKPAPTKVVKVERKTTVVQHNTINQGRQGGGLGETVVHGIAGGVGFGIGSAATGAAIDAVFSDDKPAAPPAPPFECPANFVCELVDGNWTVKAVQ